VFYVSRHCFNIEIMMLNSIRVCKKLVICVISNGNELKNYRVRCKLFFPSSVVIFSRFNLLTIYFKPWQTFYVTTIVIVRFVYYFFHGPDDWVIFEAFLLEINLQMTPFNCRKMSDVVLLVTWVLISLKCIF